MMPGLRTQATSKCGLGRKADEADEQREGTPGYTANEAGGTSYKSEALTELALYSPGYESQGGCLASEFFRGIFPCLESFTELTQS